MRTKEFIKRVEEIVDVFVEEDFQSSIQQNLRLYDKHNRTIATIDLGNEFMINTDTFEFDNLFDDKERLFNLIVEYAKTPLEEREEPKKYYLKHKWMGHEKLKYLELDTQNDEWYLGHKYDTIFVTAKNEFTQKEIEEIKEKYNTDLSDFEMIEVDE